MAERPILFSAPMVRAILDGSKTQTRRVWKMPKGMEWYVSGPLRGEETGDICDIGGKGWWSVDEVACPYGDVGDRLWVRETWQGPILDDEQLAEFSGDGADAFKKPEFCVYRATDLLDAIDSDGKELGWRPSIHMPRWASRITLEITGVRVERLNEISNVDAIAEGIEQVESPHENTLLWRDYERGHYGTVSPIASFSSLWESINGTGSWAANPWVWVIEFKKNQIEIVK